MHSKTVTIPHGDVGKKLMMLTAISKNSR